MSHTRRLSSSYQRIPSWDTVTKLARPSNIMAVDNSYHTLGTHCHLGSNSPLLKKLQNFMHISIGLLDRTLRKKSVTERIRLISVF